MNDVETRLEDYFKELAEDEEISIEKAKEITIRDNGKYALRGYGIFTDWDLPQFKVLERIDEMLIYDSDLEASEQARIDYENGLIDFKLISQDEIPNIYPLNAYAFIDTEENRKNLQKYIDKLN